MINDLLTIHYPAYYITSYQIYKEIKCEKIEITERYNMYQLAQCLIAGTKDSLVVIE